MKRTFVFALYFLLVGGLSIKAQVTTPETFFGFTPGADRMLFDYESLVGYFQKIDEQSDRITMKQIGTSPEGRPMYLAFISLPENIQNLEKYKHINRELALNPEISKEDLQRYTREGKTFVLATLSMHSSEVGPAQAAPLIAYEMATTTDPVKTGWMKDVVLMMVPNHNPDGMDKVVNHYNKYKGTKYEGSRLPEVYHKYVGHDNNRDFVTLTQDDTKALSKIFSTEWFPQVMIEKHQMGSTGPRYFVPPMHDPISENVDNEIWGWTWVFGSNMSKDLTARNLTGVSQHYLFDDYWPGSTETCIWKNVIGMLTEAASVQYATPIYIEPNELKVHGKGLSEYEISINMPAPWEGGWWHLSDIIDYEIVSTWSTLKTASNHREDILSVRNQVCRKQVEKGKSEAPYYFIFPANQHDPSELNQLTDLLIEHGVKVHQLTGDVTIEEKIFHAGDYAVILAQPFRPFIKEVLETQAFPKRHYTPDGELIKPYDITSWSLPLHRGVTAYQVDTRSESLEAKLHEYIPKEESISIGNEIKYLLLSGTSNESYSMAFQALQEEINVFRAVDTIYYNEKSFLPGSFLINIQKKSLPFTIPKSMQKAVAQLREKPESAMKKLTLPRIALMETYFHDMDAGWTRYVFDSYHIPFIVLHPGEIENADLSSFDIIVFPDSDKELLMNGKYKSSDNVYNIPFYPTEYTKGIGKEGMEKLAAYIDGGGKIVSWGRSTRLFTGELSYTPDDKKDSEKETFILPVKDISKQLSKKGLYCPGTLLNLDLKANHPITWGMPTSTKVFSRGRPVFVTNIPGFDMDRRVIGTYPKKDILASGYIEKEDLLANQTACVWLQKNKGQLILFGFGPQFRASTTATYKLLFNSLLIQ